MMQIKIYYSKNKVGLSNLINLYVALTGQSIKDTEHKYKNKLYSEFKKDLSEIIIDTLEPIQIKYLDLMKNKDYLLSVLKENSTYAPPLGVVGNYDVANERYEKEQSLSIDFTTAGIESNKGVFIKRNFDYSSGNIDQSFFIYKNIEMFIKMITNWVCASNHKSSS